MTEDEALIRAVVDSPGDDTPRLVYADWLDDQGDPRGPFLRAETGWAKPWRAGERPANDLRLRALAAGLDPVWVARVSRPPIGICCDHFIMEDSGPELSPDHLRRIEQEFGFELPVEYAAFLLNHNGGRPYPIGAWAPDTASPSYGAEYWFHPIGLNLEQDPEHSLQFEITRYLTERLPAFLERPPCPPGASVAWHWDFVPICNTPDVIFTALLGVRKPYVGQLTSIDWSSEPYGYGGVLQSFAQFLYGFEPPAEFIVPEQTRDDRDRHDSPTTHAE